MKIIDQDLLGQICGGNSNSSNSNLSVKIAVTVPIAEICNFMFLLDSYLTGNLTAASLASALNNHSAAFNNIVVDGIIIGDFLISPISPSYCLTS